jgi:hypothetical protein
MPAPFTPAQERGTGLAYMSAFFRTYLGSDLGDSDFSAILRGDAPPPPSAQVTADQLHVAYQPPDDGFRVDVNRLNSPARLATNTLGGAVNTAGLLTYTVYGDTTTVPAEARYFFTGAPGSEGGAGSPKFPHTVASRFAAARATTSQLVVRYNAAGASYENDIPAGNKDVSFDDVLQFRAAVDPTSALNPAGQPQDFSVKLTDGSGDVVSLPVSFFSNALFYPPGNVTAFGMGILPKLILNTARIPLAPYAAGGVDLTDVTEVEFDFDQTTAGSFVFDDLAFAL